MSVLESVSGQVESVPGFGVASMVYEQYAPDYLKNKDPFYVEQNGKQVRRRPPAHATDRQKQAWRSVVKTAWNYDRNFCCGCVGVDIGLGIIPIINILPVIGPIIAYTLQGSLIRKGSEVGLPASVQAKMAANCGTDFLISLCPVLGVVFSWMFGCATRNAAMFDTWLGTKKAPGQRAAPTKQPKEVKGPVYVHSDRRAQATQAPQAARTAHPHPQTQTARTAHSHAHPTHPHPHPQATQPSTTPKPYRPPAIDL